ncbi:MAG: histidine kinase [Phenylobacterium zucineum]|nr:MAG: histidine kinase [Phenylobacterium zucineum]
MATQIGASAAAARAHKELFTYWVGLKRGPKLPGRADIRPEDLKSLLPTLSLIDVKSDPLEFRLRLAGTGLYSVYGQEITGRTLQDVYNSSEAAYWETELTKIVHNRRPAAGAHDMAWRSAAHISILWLRLPLATNGIDVDMILGFDAVVGMRPEPRYQTGIRAA